MKKVTDFLPQHRAGRSFSVIINADLFEEVKNVKGEWTWPELIEACFKLFLQEQAEGFAKRTRK